MKQKKKLELVTQGEWGNTQDGNKKQKRRIITEGNKFLRFISEWRLLVHVINELSKPPKGGEKTNQMRCSLKRGGWVLGAWNISQNFMREGSLGKQLPVEREEWQAHPLQPTYKMIPGCRSAFVFLKLLRGGLFSIGWANYPHGETAWDELLAFHRYVEVELNFIFLHLIVVAGL